MNNIFVRNFCRSQINVRKLSNLTQKWIIPKVSLEWSEDKIIKTISQAAKSGGPGFFYLENHGIDSSVFEVYTKVYSRYELQISCK